MKLATLLPAACLIAVLTARAQTVSFTKSPNDPHELWFPHEPSSPTTEQQTRKDSVRKDTPPPDFLTPESAPVIRKKTEPYYPELALKAGIEGKVWVKLWITEQGKVQEAQILKSDNEIFNQAALDAARQFEFEPARLKGKPIAVWVSVPFAFKIAEKKKPPTETGHYYALIASTEDILSGRRLDSLRQAIDPSAYLVDGTRYIHLPKAIAAWGKENGFPDESGRRVQNLSGKTDAGSDMMLILMKTESPDGSAPRFHSVTWKKSGREWKIISWHVSR